MPGKRELIHPQQLGSEFDQAIEYVRKSGIGTPKQIRLDLSVAHNNLEFNITGNFFYFIESNDEADTFDVRFNTNIEPTFTLVKMMGWYTPFHTFYITNAAQPGAYAIVAYGSLSRPFIDVIDNRSPVSEGISAVRDELRGDLADEGFGRVAVNAAATLIIGNNADRKSVIIQHVPDGVGLICLGYDNTVTVANYFISLAPGEWYSVDDYRGDIYAIRTGAATNAQYGEV